jgi:hypothetical protein
MTRDELKNLGPGDLVRFVGGAEAYVVTVNYGDHAIAVRTQHVCNPAEWELVRKVTTDRRAPCPAR